jgi:hypothetical protein
VAEHSETKDRKDCAMSAQNSYCLTALNQTHDVRRVYLNTEENFTEASFARASSPSAPTNSSKKYRRAILLPTSPFEVNVMSMQGILDKASWVTDTLCLIVDELPVSGSETLKDVRDKALEYFDGGDLSTNQKYHNYAKMRFGIGYSALVDKLRGDLIECFKTAFDGILYVPEMESWRSLTVRDIVSGYEISADRDVIDELVRLGHCGHIHSQYLAALLLCFTQHGLTKQSVKLLLQAHENKHPQALDALSRLLLAQGDYVGATQAALISIEGQYPDAKSTVELVQRSLTMMVVETNHGIVPAFAGVLGSLDSQYQELARKHFSKWFPSEEERAEAFLRRLAGGVRNV